MLRIDISQIEPYVITKASSDRGSGVTRRYSKAGDPIPQAELYVWDLRNVDTSRVPPPKLIDRSTPQKERIITGVWWHQHKAKLMYTISDRRQTWRELRFVDESFMQGLRSAPAGVKNHHAYHGGLLEHVLSLMEVCYKVAPCYPNLDADILLMGAFLHDIGKIRELTYSPDLGYSDAGQLLGHLVQGVTMLDEMIAETEKMAGEEFPAKLANQLRHMIVSHHGQYEFGSPKLPMTLEAITLHYLDSLDARIHSVSQLIEEDVNKDSPWTVYHPSIGRKIYKGSN